MDKLKVAIPRKNAKFYAEPMPGEARYGSRPSGCRLVDKEKWKNWFSQTHKNQMEKALPKSSNFMGGKQDLENELQAQKARLNNWGLRVNSKFFSEK